MKYVPKTKLRGYQAKALRRAFACDGRYGLLLEPGTGKTKIGIDFACALFLQKKARTVLVICQKTGHPVWRRELKRHASVDYRVITLLGSSRKRIARLNAYRPSRERLTFILINYESVWRIEEAIFKLDPDAIIADEGHKLKNRRAKVSRAVHRLIAVLDPYRLLMTGTSISNSPLDIFSQYMVIDDSVFGRRWTTFSRRYATFHGWFNQHVRYKNLPDLRRRARSRATVLTKDECLNLDKPTYVPLPVFLTGETLRVYKEMEEEYVAFMDARDPDSVNFDPELMASAAIVLTQRLRLAQIAGGFLTLDSKKIVPVGRQKLEVLEEKLEELTNAGEKVVVFARFRPEVEAIEALCKRRKWKSYKYYGEKNAAKQKAMLRFPFAFERHNGPAVFIAQTATGSLSIDLTAACYGIFYSLDYSLVNWTQCHDRIHRGGQKRPVTYYYLIADRTVDVDDWERLQSKKKMSTLLNNRSEFLASLDKRLKV